MRALALRLLLKAEALYLRAHGWRRSDIGSNEPGGCWHAPHFGAAGVTTRQLDAVTMQRRGHVDFERAEVARPVTWWTRWHRTSDGARRVFTRGGGNVDVCRCRLSKWEHVWHCNNCGRPLEWQDVTFPKPCSTVHCPGGGAMLLCPQ